MKYPQLFSKIVMLGAGTLDPSLDNTPRADAEIRDNVLSKVFGNSSSFFYSQSPRHYAKKNLDLIKRTSPQLTLIVGTKDEVLDQNLRFFKYVRSLGLNPALVLLPGVNHSLKNYFMAGAEKIFKSF